MLGWEVGYSLDNWRPPVLCRAGVYFTAVKNTASKWHRPLKFWVDSKRLRTSSSADGTVLPLYLEHMESCFLFVQWECSCEMPRHTQGAWEADKIQSCGVSVLAPSSVWQGLSSDCEGAVQLQWDAQTLILFCTRNIPNLVCFSKGNKLLKQGPWWLLSSFEMCSVS